MEPSRTDEPILEVRGLVKHFPLNKGILFKKQVGAVQAVDGVDPGFWELMGEQDGEAARAGAHVGHACDGGRLFEPAVELRDYFKEVAAWNDGTLVDVEPVPAEKCLMRKVGRRYAVHDASAQHLLQRGAFRPGHATGEHGGPAVERKMQRAKQKIERLVMGGGGDLTDGDLVLRVEPFRMRQPAAQRARTIRGIGGNIGVGGLLHPSEAKRQT